MWKLLRPSWCLHLQASLNEEVTERVKLSPRNDEDLGNLNVIHKLILPHREVSKDEAKDEAPQKREPGLDLETRDGGHSCDGRSCVRIQSFQRKHLAP